jgi:hypothetical protein
MVQKVKIIDFNSFNSISIQTELNRNSGMRIIGWSGNRAVYFSDNEFDTDNPESDVQTYATLF